MGLGGVISNLLSLSAKLLPAVNASGVQAPSSSSSPPVEGHQIEAEMKKLMRMLERIKATLYDAEQREIRDLSVKLWLKDLKGVAYDAEDVLDEYHYEVLHAQAEAKDACPPDSRKRKLIQVPDAMFNQIQQIGNKFAEIENCRIALRLSEEEGRRCFDSEWQRAPTSHLVDVSNIFGREKEKQELIGLLSPECHDDKVVSMEAIVGTGGLGKTTLAQLVYNDIKQRSRFDIFGWICVSEDFDVNRLTKELVQSINPEDKCGLTNLSALQTKISEQIRGKRVLLVLDDVWNENRNLWDSFQAPLLSSALVRILVTTRNRQVVQIMHIEKPLNLSCLSDEESWRLFKHYAFGGVNPNEGSELVKIGKQIVKKCRMSPLAIKSIGSLLWHEEQEERWREILENELWESDASDQIFNPLQISYTHLPQKLKPCLIYCSMFPKDYVYEGESLVEEWFYHGYIECKGKEDAKKIGQKYAKQLWQRSFFEPCGGGDEFDSELKLHDIIHDLARLNSDNECCSIVAGKLPVSPNKVCHLYVAGSVGPTEPIPFCSFTTLRTLIMGRDVQNCFSNFDLSMAQKLRVLKIVGNENFLLASLLELESLYAVGNLKHLRFLSLCNLYIKELPESICSLYKLQELTLVHCSLEKWPTSIRNLVSLEKLNLTRVDLRVLPESFCQLKALRELALLHCSLEELPTSIGNLVSLEKLKLRDAGLRVLPESFCQLKALRELALFHCSLKELPTSIGNLVSLEKLNLSDAGLRVLPESFCQLKALRELTIWGPELKELPSDIGSLASLQALDIDDCQLMAPYPDRPIDEE